MSSSKSKFAKLNKNKEQLLCSKILDFLTDKEKVLVVYDISKFMRNCMIFYYKNKSLSIDKKGVISCVKELKTVIKTIVEFKFITSNHSETIEDSLKKFIEGHKVFNFYRSLLVIPSLIFNSLQMLDLNHVNMGYDGIMLLNPFIKKTKTVTVLNLGYNNIGDDGCAFLRIGLEKNTSLISLILECNGISNYGFQYLIDPLIKHKSLKSLKMCLNVITIDGLKEFSSKLDTRKATPFQVLDFKFNNVDIKDENIDIFKKFKIMY